MGRKKSDETTTPEPASSAELLTNKLDTIIGQGVSINGIVKSEGTLRVDGKIEGELRSTGDLIIGETGMVTANIVAQNVSVAGTINGNIKASGKLDLLASGKIFGDINISDMVVSQGATIHGRVKTIRPTGEEPEHK